MKTKKLIKKIVCMVLVLLIFCLSHLLAEPCGDVNSDGAIDILDALLIAQYYVDQNPENFDQNAADVNADGSIDILDSLLVAQYYVGLISELPGCGPTPTPGSITYELQAEDQEWGPQSPGVESDHPGYSGIGYVNTENVVGAWIEWSFDLSADSTAECVFRYACGSDDRPMDLSINGSIVSDLGFPSSGAWDTWATETADTVTLSAGPVAIRIIATTSGGAPNMDKMDITITGGVIVAPTVPPTPVPTETPTPTPTWDPNNPNPIGLYRTYEHTLTNNNNYSNKFTDVELNVTYTSPSGETIDFFGFFDGDGNGGGDLDSGNVWKMRFMPDELGPWTYTWTWSDGTPGGSGIFTAVPEGAGKGILRAYQDNPRWMAYNGTEPVFIKSYYETGHAAIAQPFDWIKTYVYQPMLDHGYNYLQVNWLFPLCCDQQWYRDGPPKSIERLRLYDDGEVTTTMRFNIWHMMEEHIQWLNDRNVALYMFMGFDASKNGGPKWKSLSNAEQDFYVKYVVARLAPYACMAGWNYTHEVHGNDESGELDLARVLMKYDIFKHFSTYEDKRPLDHEFHRPEYNLASVENHGVSEVDEFKDAWTHHVSCLAVYYPGKPVYMSEGNALWRRYWQERTGATQDDLRQSAWACTTAGASFNWNGHLSENNLEAFGPDGLPFNNPENVYSESEKHIEILTRCMNDEVVFYRMTPQDSLLSEQDDRATWCLAEPGQQYLVFTISGKSFNLNVESGEYNNNIWLDTKTGDQLSADPVDGGGSRSFTPPNTSTDWVLILRRS